MYSKIPILAAIFLFCTCSSSPQINYPDHPRSILVMPPVNLSVDIAAPVTFLATSTIPLAEAGYYVIPVALSAQMFIENGVTVAEEAHGIPYARLHEIFGADSALYITIIQYGAIYYVLGSAVTAQASAKLVDLRTGRELWSGRVDVTENPSSASNRGILGTLVGAVIDQIAHTLSNRAYTVGRNANYKLLSPGSKNSILYGPYHPLYGP
ncbi:MAG: DUF799 domain-containing protein [Treponema sp.]|nr:DUF799 domain-containing protein [Treponema sp.]